MANKSINALDNTSTLDNQDLLVLWKASANAAYNISGQDFTTMLTSLADGHGGISGIAKTSTAGLNDTYTITYADGTTSTFTVTNGAKGDQGNQTFVWIAYSETSPTSDADISVIPAPWMGIYVGLESTQGNLHYTDYTWYQIKGPKGDGVAYTAKTGEVGLTSTYTMYTADGTAVGTFSVTNGEGGVSTVNGIAPDGDGDVSTVVGSVEDLGLTSGSATIAGAYAELLDKQVLICPASDFAVGELPLVGGSRQTDGAIEIVKGDGTDGWIEFHGRLSSVGDFRMFFNSSDVPVGTWIPASQVSLWGSFSHNPSYITAENNRMSVLKCGKIVQFVGYIYPTIQVPAYGSVGTIQAGFRPEQGTSILLIPAGRPTFPYWTFIGTDGSVGVQDTALPPNNYYYISATYITP